MLEKDVEKELRLAAVAAGGECYKWVSPGCDGVPDRIVLLPGGRIAFVETKSDIGKLRPSQVRRIKRLRKLGFYAFVVSSKDHARKIVASLKTLPR